MSDFTYQEGAALTWAQMNENLRLMQAKYLDSANSAAIAIAAANFKGNWSALTGALAVPASVYHASKFWLLLSNLADVTAATPGVSGSWLEIITGNVMGPASATAGNLAVLDATGKVLSDGGVAPAALMPKAGGVFTGDVTAPSINGGQLAGLRNAIINGNFSISQRAPATNADDTYSHDRWYALTQTGTIAITTLTGVENGTPHAARLTQSQATAQRMGYAQIIEGVNCKHLRGKQVTFRFGRSRLSTSANVRYAVLEWTGTEDAVTSDVVNDWTSASYTAGGFFVASNITVSGVVQQALTANTLADGSAVTVTLGSSFNNLILLAWTEGTAAQNVTFDLAKAQFEYGPVATPFEHRPRGLELALCQRYYYRTVNAAGIGAIGFGGYAASTTTARVFMPLPVPMRANPTSIEVTGTGTDYAWSIGASGYNAVPTYSNISSNAILALDYTGSGLTVGQGAYLRQSTSAGYVGVSTEL